MRRKACRFFKQICSCAWYLFCFIPRMNPGVIQFKALRAKSRRREMLVTRGKMTKEWHPGNTVRETSSGNESSSMCYPGSGRIDRIIDEYLRTKLNDLKQRRTFILLSFRRRHDWELKISVAKSACWKKISPHASSKWQLVGRFAFYPSKTFLMNRKF